MMKREVNHSELPYYKTETLFIDRYRLSGEKYPRYYLKRFHADIFLNRSQFEHLKVN